MSQLCNSYLEWNISLIYTNNAKVESLPMAKVESSSPTLTTLMLKTGDSVALVYLVICPGCAIPTLKCLCLVAFLIGSVRG
jgi:hypothetical protein